MVRNSLPSFKPLSETRLRTSFINCSVASMPISLINKVVSNSSYKSSSILPPPNTPANDFAIWLRDLVKPCLSRAVQPSLSDSICSGGMAATVATVAVSTNSPLTTLLVKLNPLSGCILRDDVFTSTFN